MIQNSYNDTPSLYLIPTPIGNLDDMTYRAVKVLEEVEVIFSEDTRVTLNLLNNFGIKKKLISLHEHNEDILKEKVLEYLKNGYSVGLVTDRGTPIISDPGYKTVKYISDNNYNVIALPGATAFVCALIASGISPQPFLFYGFLNSKDSKRRDELEMLKDNEKERKPKKQTKSYDEQIAEYTQNEELQEALKAFIQMRSFIKKPLTEYGLKLLLNKLSKIGRTDAEKIAIVNRSVEHNWQGFFEIKEESSYQKPAQPEKKYDQNSYESEEEFMKMFYGK